jgi:hypothetical protein
MKCSEWYVEPTIRGPVPPNINYILPEGALTSPHEIYSIDGELYPAQNVKGVVRPQILPIYQ